MNNYEQDLINSIMEGKKKLYSPSYTNQKRSSSKVDDLHYTILRHISSELNDTNFELFSKLTDKKEKVVHGFYYDKKTDICIVDKKTNEEVATIEFKWLLSSIQKNNKNFMSNLIGDATNIRKKGLKTFWVYCIRNVTPVYKAKQLSSTYTLTSSFFDQFKNLFKGGAEDQNVPNAMCLSIYSDNINIQNFKTEKDLESYYFENIKNNSLEVKLDNNYNEVVGSLFINNYNLFIKEICKEIRGN